MTILGCCARGAVKGESQSMGELAFAANLKVHMYTHMYTTSYTVAAQGIRHWVTGFITTILTVHNQGGWSALTEHEAPVVQYLRSARLMCDESWPSRG